MTGELNLTKCGDNIRINSASDWIDIKIGNGIWLTLTKDQVQALKNKLNQEVE